MAKKPGKTKSASVPCAVQSREQCVEAIRRAGSVSRMIAQINADASEEIGKLAAKRDADTVDLKTELAQLNKDIQTFAEANRDALTNGRKVKSHDFGTGTVSWRTRPPSVTLRNVDGILTACKKLGLDRFIRRKEEVNKDAMLEEKDIAASITGVSIGSEGEDFSIEVLELANSDARAA